MFGINVFKIYFYILYNILKSHWAFEVYFSDFKIFHRMIYLLSYKHDKSSSFWSDEESFKIIIFKKLSDCTLGAYTFSLAVIFACFSHDISAFLGTVCSSIIWLALTFAAHLLYLIVYKMKHFVLYIFNLLHSIS